MLDTKGFDLWADGYDTSVNMSEEANNYPFAGYKRVLNYIYNRVKQGKGKKILDIGFGTGVLTKKLYDDEFSVFGMDFSDKMIEISKEKMPKASFIKHDFSKGFPVVWENETYDYIICTYAIHHLDNMQKNDFLQTLLNKLSPNGKILIGDVAFETLNEMEKCKSNNENDWDNDEIYPVAEVLSQHFPTLTFEKISFCAGVITLTK